jgi:fructosamine-3-kinase
METDREIILATRADYLEDYSERRSLYQQALDLAKKSHDTKEIEEIMDSIKQLDEEEKAEPDAGADVPKRAATQLGH